MREQHGLDPQGTPASLPPLVLEKQHALAPLDQDPVEQLQPRKNQRPSPATRQGGLTSAEGWGYWGMRGIGKVIILEFKSFLYPQCLNL